jgi:hypothetical protein
MFRSVVSATVPIAQANSKRNTGLTCTYTVDPALGQSKLLGTSDKEKRFSAVIWSDNEVDTPFEPIPATEQSMLAVIRKALLMVLVSLERRFASDGTGIAVSAGVEKSSRGDATERCCVT